MTTRRDDEPCGKATYTSKDAARRAHAKAHWRLHIYYCVACRGFHASNGEKP